MSSVSGIELINSTRLRSNRRTLRRGGFYFVEALETRRLLAATLLAMETFDTNVSAATPDAFDTATGTVYSDAIGPTTPATAGTIGVSGDPEQNGNQQSPNPSVQDTWLLTGSNKASAALDGGFIGGWFRFTLEDPDSYYSHITALMQVNGAQGLYLDSNNQLETGPDSPIASIPLNEWVFIGMAWTYNPSTQAFNYEAYTEPLGQSLTSVYTSATSTLQNAPLDAELDDFGPDNVCWEGRVGTFFIDSISSFSNVAIPSKITAPVEQKVWFGVDPVNGNDKNDGVVIPIFASNGTTVIGFASGSQPWQTLTRVNTALAYAGILTQNVAWVNASNDTPANESLPATTLEADITAGTIIRNPLLDELVIDTASGPFNISASGGINGAGGIQLNTNVNLSGFGSDVGSMTNVGDLEGFTTIDKDSWSAVAGYPNVYETGETAVNAVLWQNREWMNHPLGNSFSDVAEYLESTPGSFWTDGTTMYVDPFGNTDPATDSSIYQRSPGGTSSNSIGVLININDAYIHNLAIGGTCGAMPDEQDAIGLYCLGGGGGGLCYLDDLYLYYSDKHAYASTNQDSNDRLILNNVDAEQGSPYTEFGGQYLFTNYNQSATATGNEALYIDCTSVHSWGLIGSTEGVTIPDQGTYYSHNDGGSDQFSIVTFIDCSFDAGIMCTNAIDDLVVMNTSCGYIGSGATTLTAQNVITAYDVIRASAGTVTNCVMNIQTGYGAGSNNNNYDGDVTYTDCEFNYSSAVVEDWPSIFYATGPCSLTITHSIFIGGESNTLPVLDSFQSSDTIDFANNIYDTNAAFVVASRFTDDGSESLFLSLAQWQALGYDTGSVAPSAATESAYTDVDIGAPATPGMTLYDSDNGEWADIAGGAGIGGESDQFNFAYTPISGSATLLSDVIMQAGLESATAGVMFRDSTAADGAFADAVVTQDQSVEFQWRSSDGAAVQSVTVGGISGAVELEVVRNGNSFSAYYSEGNGWTEIGTAESVSMPTTALLGMAVSGGNNSVAGAAIFSNTGWDFGPPVVASFQVNDGSVQRAMVDSLTVTFNEPVTLASNALTIEQLSTTGGSPTSMSFSQTTSNDITWVLTFTDASYIGGSLPDGKYDLIVSSSAVTDAGGQPISGTNPTFAFSRLYGDFGGQGVVNAQDFTILSANFGAILSPSLWYLDFYGQGTVNGSDFMEFSQRFGTILPTVSAEGVAAMPASADAVAVSATTSSPAPALLAQPDLHVMPKALPAAQPPSPGNDSPDWFDLLKKDADRIPSILREAPADL